VSQRKHALRLAEGRATDLAKHSLVISGHRTSISLERAFWEALRKIARGRDISIAALVASVDAERDAANLSSALRVFVLNEMACRGAAARHSSPTV
jgi:predicted DNA-binding ribbon-helix-helix protein